MHKTILFLLAFLITPITASYGIPCNERPCSVTAEETMDSEDDFVCKWFSIPQDVILTDGVKSDDGYCYKAWYCKKDGHYTKVHTKNPNNEFDYVSCEPCPNACRDDDTSCIQKANVVTRRNSTQNYSYARSVNACYLKIIHTHNDNEDETPTGSDEIGSFRTKKSDNVYTCSY